MFISTLKEAAINAILFLERNFSSFFGARTVSVLLLRELGYWLDFNLDIK